MMFNSLGEALGIKYVAIMKRGLFYLILCFGLLASCAHKSGHRNNAHLEINNKEKRDTIVEQSDLQFLLALKTDDSNQIILERKGYSLSYNPNLLIPNWVAWHLMAEHADGEWSRDNNYYEDEEVPLPRASNDDYKGSGWTHGHMCPAGDNKWDEVAMRESNLLTNICPQHASLNSGLWNVIERDCRKWALEYGDLYIVCGPILLNKDHETIGANKVVVPEAFFKVILCLKPKPKAIGFIIRNNEGKKKRDQYINTVDEVERITGIDFFPALPDDIENVVEANANLDDWR